MKYRIHLIFPVVFMVQINLFSQDIAIEPYKTMGVPNGIWITDSINHNGGFYIDQTEVANIHWLEYMTSASLTGETIPDYMLPDTSVWEKTPFYWILIKDTVDKHGSISATEPNANLSNYLRYPGYRFFPVVGISKDQAENFCQWRSKIVTNNIKQDLVKDKNFQLLLENYDFRIHFRLPTEREWELAARGGQKNAYSLEENVLQDNDFLKYAKYLKKTHFRDTSLNYPQIAKDLKRFYQQDPFYFTKKRFAPSKVFNTKYRSNYILDKISSFNSTKTAPTEFIFSGRPNAFGIYGMIGNVAEWIEEENLSKGGSWNAYLEDCAIKKSKVETEPTAYIGFRCVCDILISPKK